MAITKAEYVFSHFVKEIASKGETRKIICLQKFPRRKVSRIQNSDTPVIFLTLLYFVLHFSIVNHTEYTQDSSNSGPAGNPPSIVIGQECPIYLSTVPRHNALISNHQFITQRGADKIEDQDNVSIHCA